MLEYIPAYALNTIKEKIIVWYGRFYCSKNNLKKVKITIVIDKIIIIIIYININYLGNIKMNNLQEKIELLERENNRLQNVERIYSKYLDKAYQEIKDLNDTLKTIRQNKENKKDM